MQTVRVSEDTIQPSAYSRMSLKAFSAISVSTRDSRGVVTVNQPRAAFMGRSGTLTIQGQTPAQTLRCKSRDAEIIAFYIGSDHEEAKVDTGVINPTLDDLLSALYGNPWGE